MRRLWLGDWQRGDEEPALTQRIGTDSDPDDTVVVLPDDDAGEPPRPQHQSNPKRAIAAGAAIAALCALIFALFSGGDNSQRNSAFEQVPPGQTPQTQIPQTPQVPQGAPQSGFGGADLTGAAAEKAAKAATAKFPGDIERVTAGPGGGGYVVHVIQSDGCEVHVVVSGGFKVLGSDAGQGGCARGVPPSGATPQGGSTNQS
ncbi:MAG TPA: hypothetical protein VH300_11445 [Thermoleophilaceae bacterium]|nr:hypothetical protein [Thermoleophilaceae bacterium]